MTISALPSMICANVSNGEVFSVNPSPVSNDMILILPVDFLMIVLLRTALGTYSIISTIINPFDFSISLVSILGLIYQYSLRTYNRSNVLQLHHCISLQMYGLMEWNLLHNFAYSLHDSH